MTPGGQPVRGEIANALPSPPRFMTVRADALKLPDGTPLKNIEQHRDQDVLCGRGGGTNHHCGNAHWRKLVNANKRLYLSLPKKQKALVAKSIVHAIRAQKPPGRFLSRDPSNSLWCDIGDQKATEKTSQALREGAPDIRTEMAKEGHRENAPGQILQNGLIGLERNKPGDTTLLASKEEDAIPPDAADMSTANPVPISSQGGLPLPVDVGENASMMKAFHQFLGGGNNPYSLSTQPTAPLSGITMPTQACSSQASLLKQQPQQQHQQQQQQQQQPHQQHQQQQPFGSLASLQLIHSHLGSEMTYPQTLMSRVMSGQPINDDVQNRLRDTQVIQTNPQLNFGNEKMMMIYNQLALQKAANGSATAGMHMTNQAAPAMIYQPGQVASLNNEFGWSVPTGVPLGGGSQLMTDLFRTSSLSSATALGTTNYPVNPNFTNSLFGNTASTVAGSNFYSQAESNALPRADSNTLARLLGQHSSLLNNQLLGKTVPPQLDPSNLYSMTSLGLLSYPSLPSGSSLTGQLSGPAAPPNDLGQCINSGPDLTLLQPSVSTVFEQLLKKHMPRTEAPQLNPEAVQQLNSFRDNTSISIPTTAAPKRGVSASLEDLCRAAGLDQLQQRGSVSDLVKKGKHEDEDLDEKSQREFCNRAKTKKRASKKRIDNPKITSPKLGVNDSSLVDDDDSDEEANTKFVSTKRKRDEPKISVEEHSKQVKIRTNGEDKEFDRFAQKPEGSRNADLLARGANLNRIASVSFSQKIEGLPLPETTFDRGHSLAMSEISLDRGQSLSGTGFMGDGNDGQFDDASEDEDQVPTFASKTKKVERGCTLGTINTFPLG